MIAHQHIGVYVKLVRGSQFDRQFTIEKLVFGVDECGTSIDAALRDVKRDAGNEQTRASMNVGKRAAAGTAASPTIGPPLSADCRVRVWEKTAIQTDRSSVTLSLELIKRMAFGNRESAYFFLEITDAFPGKTR